jgi:hypothetical protein
MSQAPTDIVQSFQLRFWREPHEGTPARWRGKIWHEQQGLDERPTSVDNPEEAFEVVRRTLYHISTTAPLSVGHGMTPFNEDIHRLCLRAFSHLVREKALRLRSLWRRSRGIQQ